MIDQLPIHIPHGSVLRSDFRPDSNVELLGEFDPGQKVGFKKLAGMEIELTEMLGRPVDLRTENSVAISGRKCLTPHR